jgi:hypothetical protein
MFPNSWYDNTSYLEFFNNNPKRYFCSCGVLRSPDWYLKMEPIHFPETTVISYQPTLGKIPEKQIFHLRRGANLISNPADRTRNSIFSEL